MIQSQMHTDKHGLDKVRSQVCNCTMRFIYNKSQDQILHYLKVSGLRLGSVFNFKNFMEWQSCYIAICVHLCLSVVNEIEKE